MAELEHPGAPTLVVLAGPNGAGKSSLWHRHLLHLTESTNTFVGPFLNADDYARWRWGLGHDLEHAYEAAQTIAKQRDELLATGEPFVTETVFSHPSKLDLIVEARDRGYYVFLEIVVVPVETSIERVAQRVAEGGHDVPEEKIRARLVRADELLAQAIPHAHQARIWQNVINDTAHPADQQRAHQRIARFVNGALKVQTRTPDWLGPHLSAAIRDAPKVG